MNRPEFHFLKSTLAVVIPSLMAVSAPLANAQREIATGIEEVVVTAQKREENLQEVPLAVTALDAAALDRTFARDLLDITGKAPNLIVDPVLGNGTATISIRGMQLNDVEKSFDPAVAVYLDGVYLATTTGALLQVWDAEAVEVLRGPKVPCSGATPLAVWCISAGPNRPESWVVASPVRLAATGAPTSTPR